MCPNQEIVPERPVALVLGASRGLGLLIAEQLLRRGHLVVVAARDVAEVEAAARALEAFGPVRAERCDVRDRHEVGDLVGRVEHSIGPIEVLVTVAGIIQTAPAESLVLHEFEDAIETMAWGPIHAAMTVLPHMRRRGHGRIGTVTSVGGMVSAAPAAVRDGEVRRRRLLGRPRISPER